MTDWSYFALEAEDLLKRLREAARERKRGEACKLAVSLARCALEMLVALKTL